MNFFSVPPSSVRILTRTASNDGLKSYKNSEDNEIDEPKETPITNMITVRSNREEYLTCESSGSRPRATLVWKKNGLVVTAGIYASPSADEQDLTHGFSYSPAVSTLLILPTIKDHKTTISCRAFSPKLPDEHLEDEVLLNVLCEYKKFITQ